MLLLPAFALAGCGEADPPEESAPPEATSELGPSPEQEVFWANLQALCGEAFVGETIEAPSTSDWWESELIMHVRECSDDEIRIPLHVDDDRSRTWVVSRSDTGLRLKHDHRLADGTPDTTNTDYGGDTGEPGTEIRQEFPADQYSIDAVPGRADQFWFLEVLPGEIFAYGLLREATEGEGLRYRVEFDLTRPVEPPPAPWGFEG